MTRDVLKYLQPNAAIPIDMETTSLLVNALKKALADHAMKETQRLGQEIEPVADYIAAKDMLDEQPVPPRTWIGLENAEAGWFCHTDFLNARKYTKKQREYICNQLLSEAQSWDIDQYTRMMHDSTKLKEST